VRIAAVPVKDLGDAKQRLRTVLGPAERAALARTMLADVLEALAAAALDAVWVITRDAEAQAVAQAFGAVVLREEANRGHTSAVTLAQTRAAEAGAAVFVTVPGDVPCVRAAEIDALVGAAAPAPAAVFAPSRSGQGTNGVALAPAGLMPLQFGEPSLERHLGAARERGLQPTVLRLPGLGLDVDGPDDLQALAVAGPDTRSGRLAAAWRVAERSAGRAG
jgi:2-phospho-L-lactate/phosphoenolpyruvate guanylyltransferase